MDELTIEQKAKAYDEVVNKLKGFIAQGVNPLITRDDVQDFFPELAESEDEKIRKELITIISCAGDDSSHIYMSKRDSERYVAWLEKQGEKNPVDKVEPKFEIEKGKWYVCNTSRYTGFVVGKAYYCPKNGMLKPNENEMARYIAKHYFRLWTVEDAKDGDVLSDGTTIFIFKDLLSDGSVMSYCDYDTDSSDSDSFCHLSVNLMCSKITPATKEQHDLLFQKMKEAGYWWDAEKKELKEIEQKPTNIVTVLNDYFANTPKEQQDKDWEELKHLNNFGWEVVEQKPAWSEEDKRSIRDSIFYLKSAKKYFEKDDDILWDEKWFNLCIEFLEALYKKLQPQTTWKPSDEEIEALEHFVRSVGESGYASPYDNNTKLLYSLLSDLKKLKG